VFNVTRNTRLVMLSYQGPDSFSTDHFCLSGLKTSRDIIGPDGEIGQTLDIGFSSSLHETSTSARRSPCLFSGSLWCIECSLTLPTSELGWLSPATGGRRSRIRLRSPPIRMMGPWKRMLALLTLQPHGATWTLRTQFSTGLLLPYPRQE
jgi:hypothetical protein